MGVEEQQLWTAWMMVLLRVLPGPATAERCPWLAVMLDAVDGASATDGTDVNVVQDPLGHAELVALSQAAAIRSDWRFQPLHH